MSRDRHHKIVHASWISLIGNAILAFLKITIGLISNSLAVVGDGIDSATDIITSLIVLITARIVSKPPDLKFSYGYERADSIASKSLAFVIFFAGAQLSISTVKNIIHYELYQIPSKFAIYVTIVSIVGKLFLSIYQFKIGKKINSPMLIANAKNMQNDILISFTVFTGLLFVFILELPIIDSIIALAVSVWIMVSAYRIYMESNYELMDGIKDPSIYKKVFNAVDKVEGVINPHRVRLRKIGYKYVIVIDIEVDHQLTVIEAHNIANKVEQSIKSTIENIYDIVVHMEPHGIQHKEEKYGVNRENLK